jgi:cytochrome oxidase Cu insertion factor (SCO1/SenC/PrrC family)
MNAPSEPAAPSIRRARLKLLGIAAVFAGPLLAASLAYLARDVLPVPEPVSHGEIIEPARPLKPFSLATPTGGRLKLEDLRGHWTLVFVDGACDKDCKKILYYTRQIREALGRDADRVRRLYLLTTAVSPGDLNALLAEHPGLLMAFASPEQARFTLQLTDSEKENAVYVVDPLGNLMMRYSERAKPKGMLKDLKKLLRISRVG